MAENGDLLKRAVVSLEKKLRESTSTVAALQRELQDARQQAAELPAVRARLAEVTAGQAAAEEQAQQSARSAVAAQVAAEDAERQRDRAAREAGDAEEAAARQAAAADRWRGDAEQLRMEAARARGQAELLEQQVQQLEACNAGLRQDNQQHAAKLKEAYEREGELLAEVAQLQAQLRRQQGARPAASGPASSSTAPAVQASVHVNGSLSAPPSGSMEHMHRELFLAAAQQLTAEFSSKVEQAERRASQLERQLEGLARPAALLQRQVGELRAELQAAQEQCSKEQEAAAALLEANLRLHETVLLLVEQGSGTGRQAAEQDEEEELGQHEQEQRGRKGPFAERPADRLGRPSTAVAAAGQRPQGARGPVARQNTAGRLSGQMLSRRPDEPQQRRQQQGPAAAAAPAALAPRQAAGTGLLCAAASQPQKKVVPAHSQQHAAARQAAVTAALALSAEHRELFARHKAAAAELQRTASCLAIAAAPGKQLALLRRHAELQEEVRDINAGLEDKAVQLAALRRAGLL
ncbi:hypothetical protein ABPG75_009548 [Micractinium tetrahymenae]